MTPVLLSKYLTLPYSPFWWGCATKPCPREEMERGERLDVLTQQMLLRPPDHEPEGGSSASGLGGLGQPNPNQRKRNCGKRKLR